jgi:hypothetical protein
MVGGDDDDGVVQQPKRRELAPQSSQLLVNVGDLAVVGRRPIPLRKGRRRVIVGMGIEVVDEQEERSAETAGHGDRPIGHGGGPALRDHEATAAHRVVVHAEAPLEPVLPIQHGGGDHGRRVVARLRQPAREGLGTLRQAVDAVVANAVAVGEQPGQDRRVGGERDRHGREGLLEHDPVGRPTVDIRRRGRLIPIAAKVVGPGGVEADQQDRRRLGESSGFRSRGNPG